MTKDEMRAVLRSLPPLAGPFGGVLAIVDALVERLPDEVQASFEPPAPTKKKG